MHYMKILPSSMQYSTEIHFSIPVGVSDSLEVPISQAPDVEDCVADGDALKVSCLPEVHSGEKS